MLRNELSQLQVCRLRQLGKRGQVWAEARAAKGTSWAGRDRRHGVGSSLRPCLPPRPQVDPSKKGALIGSGGRTIKQLMEASGATSINIEDDGQVCGDWSQREHQWSGGTRKAREAGGMRQGPCCETWS